MAKVCQCPHIIRHIGELYPHYLRLSPCGRVAEPSHPAPANRLHPTLSPCGRVAESEPQAMGDAERGKRLHLTLSPCGRVAESEPQAMGDAERGKRLHLTLSPCGRVAESEPQAMGDAERGQVVLSTLLASPPHGSPASFALGLPTLPRGESVALCARVGFVLAQEYLPRGENDARCDPVRTNSLRVPLARGMIVGIVLEVLDEAWLASREGRALVLRAACPARGE